MRKMTNSSLNIDIMSTILNEISLRLVHHNAIGIGIWWLIPISIVLYFRPSNLKPFLNWAASSWGSSSLYWPMRKWSPESTPSFRGFTRLVTDETCHLNGTVKFRWTCRYRSRWLSIDCTSLLRHQRTIDFLCCSICIF